MLLKLLRSAFAWLLSLAADEAFLWAVVALFPTVGAVIIAVALGVLQDLQWYTIIFIAVVTGLVSFSLIGLVLTLGAWLTRRKVFRVKPLSGDTSGFYVIPAGEPDPTEPKIIHARLEVESRSFLRNCSATVTGLSRVDRQQRLQRLGGNDQLTALYWTEPDHARTRDLTPGLPATIIVATLDQKDPSKFGLGSTKYPPGWYKIEVLLTSESEERAEQSVELKLGLGTRDYPPPPLGLHFWKDGDEKRVEG